MDDTHPHKYPHLTNADGSEYILEIGDTDIHGNKHPDHDEFETEMERRYQENLTRSRMDLNTSEKINRPF